MKIKLLYLTLAFTTVLFSSCKKDSGLKFTKQNSSAAVSGVLSNSVLTVAGKPYSSGPTLINGQGATARFYNPYGIQLMDDGSLFASI